jgi:hypothetical protein
LARRLPVKIDYDLARTVAKNNLLLTHGKYILDLSTRINTVQLFGAINATNNVDHRGHTDVSEYINDQYRFWSATLQLFPWLQSTVRYTDVRTRLYSPFPEFSGDQTLKDKGIDVKFRLLEESYYLPELSLGFRDFGGTGFFESEFVGLSKQVSNFNFHLNMGWGYLGTTNNISNPFCNVKDSFCDRPSGFTDLGGKIDYQRFFKGPASIFGGVEYQTP